MSSVLLPLYGPFAIQSYGVAIACGLALFLWLMHKDARLKAIVDPATFNNIIALGIIAGAAGGRLLYLLSGENNVTISESFMPWIGGFSILGTILGVAVVIPLYLAYLKVPILPLLDLAGLYAPLMQAIARFGCFFAGCCYGMPADLPWAITYSSVDSLAPCFVSLHPTQLYSSIALLTVFTILYCFVQQRCTKPGQLMCFYLIGIGIERFCVDFWRADRIFGSAIFFQFLSIHQWIASGIVIGACGVLAYLSVESNS